MAVDFVDLAHAQAHRDDLITAIANCDRQLSERRSDSPSAELVQWRLKAIRAKDHYSRELRDTKSWIVRHLEAFTTESPDAKDQIEATTGHARASVYQLIDMTKSLARENLEIRAKLAEYEGQVTVPIGEGGDAWEGQP